MVLLGGAGQAVGRLAGGDAARPRGERLVRVDAPGPRGGTPAVLGLLGVTGRVRCIQLGLIAVIEKRMTCEEKIVAGLAPNSSFDAMDMPQEVLDMLGVAKDQVSA